MTDQIPFVDLRAQYRTVERDVEEAVSRVLGSGQYVLGEETAAFEQEFAQFCGVDYAVAVNSGTSALHLALVAAGIGPGDEVITVSMTFVATVAAILYSGACPVLIDIDPFTWTMAPDQIEAVISSRTKAILPVHLHGQPAEMETIIRIARKHGLLVIEDACQAHGARYGGRRVGSIGDLACFSFYPSKNLGGIGDSGMVTTNNPQWSQRMRSLRDWGSEQSNRYEHGQLGYNYRMAAIQAAALRVNLTRLDQWNLARQHIAAEYVRHFKEMDVRLPAIRSDREHVYHIFGIRTQQRSAVQRLLKGAGVQTGMHYPVPVHQQRGYVDLVRVPHPLPETESFAYETLSLPLYPEQDPTTVTRIADICRDIE